MNFIVFASLLLIFSTAVPTEGLPYEVTERFDIEDVELIFHGFTEVDVRSREIKDLAQVAVNRHVHDVKSECDYDVKKIRRAGIQIFRLAGVKTALRLKICPSDHCGNKGEECEECYVETFEHNRTKLFEVTNFYCVPIRNSEKQ